MAVICLGGLARPACAATYWWNTTTTGLWSAGANWSNAASGGSAGQAPTSNTTTDDAVFNQTAVNGNTIVELDAARSIAGITFLNTGSTLLRASASGTQTLTLGARGITLGDGMGPVTIGDATNAISVTLGSNPITNNSASLLLFRNGLNANSATLTVTGTGTGEVRVEGPGRGINRITKSGPGTLTLTGSNEISGGSATTDIVTINGGTLAISGTGFLAGGSQGSTYGSMPMYSNDMTNNGAFVHSSSSSQTMFSIISGTGSFTMAGPSRFYFLRNNTYTGLTTISSGTLVVGNWQNVGNFAGNVVNNGVLIFDANAGGSDSVAFRRVMSGTGRVVLSGGVTQSTTLTLSGSTEFGGRFAVRGGSLTLNFGGTNATGGTTLTNIVAPTASVFLGQGTANGWTPGQLPAFTNTLTVTGSAGVANSQSLAGVTIDDGLARVTVTSPAGGSTTLSMGELRRSAGSRGIVNVTGTAAGTVSILTTTTNANGIIGPWATVTAAGGAIQWATSAAAGGTAGELTAYFAYTPDSWSAGANTNVTGNNTVPANAVTNSLRFGTGVTLTLSGTSTVTSGGVLFAAGNSTITGGALRGSPTDGLQITTNASPTIASPIVDNGGPTPLTFIPLSGALTLSGQSTYTGRTTLMGSVVLASVETGTSGPLGLGGSIEFPASSGVRSDGFPRFTYGRLNSHDYSTRFTTAADQIFSGSVPAHQRVTWSGSFGNAGTGGLNLALNGALTLTGSNAFPNGVWLQGVQGTLTLGSIDAIGSSGQIFLNSGQSSEGGGPRLQFTAASAGLDLGSRLTMGSVNFMQLDTNGQDVTFRTRVSATNQLRFFKQGDGRLTLSGSASQMGFIVVGGTLALDSGTIAAAWDSPQWLAGMGVGTFQFSGAATGTRTQTVPGLFPQAGLLTVAVQSTGTTTMLDITGGITRSTAAVDGNGQFSGNLGTVDFRAAGGTFGTTAIVRTVASQALTNGIIGPWATVNGTDWATHTSGTILPYAAYTDVTTDSIADGATTNARITTTTGTVTLGATTTTVNTLLQAAPTAATISLSGSTLLTGGVMAASGAGRLTIGDSVGAGTLQPASAGGEIVLSNFSSGTMTVNSVIANNASASRLTISGNGTVVLTASNTLTGVTAVQGGTLRIGDGGTTGSLASSSVYLSAGARLVFDRTDDYGGQAAYTIGTMGYAMGSPGGIEVRGGNLTLAGNNTYHGRTLLAGGTVTMANDNALNQSTTIQVGYRTGPITFTGGVLRYASSGVTMTQDLSGRIVDSTSPIVVDTNGLSGTWGFSVAASNVAGLTKRGGGTLSLTNINAYLGTTTIEGGRLVGAAQSFPGNVVNSGTLTFSTDGINLGGVHAGVISGAGRVAVNSAAFLPTTLTGTSTFAAVPVVEQGRLDIGWSAPAGQASPLGTSGTVSLGTTGIGGLLGYSGAANLTFDRVLDLGSATIGGGVAADGAGAFIVTSNLGVSGAGTKTFTLTGSGTAANEFRGVISNNSGSNLTNISKTGGGVWQLTGANTFTGTVSITEGTLSVPTLTNVGVNGPLGSGTGNAAAIRVGSTAARAALRYTGTGAGSTNRGITLTGTGALEASGAGAVTFGAVTGSAGANTLILGGTSLANNTLGVISDAPSSGVTSVVKDGSGLWRLSAVSSFTGGLTVRDGTVIADVNSGDYAATGAFGTANAVTVGDTTAGAAGAAALLVAPGVRVSRQVLVPAATGGGTQTVLLGSTGTSGTPGAFEGDARIQLGRAVTLVAVAGGTTNFSNTWSNFDNTGTTNASISVGSAAYAGTVLVNNALATLGAVNVRFGRLDVAMGKTVTAAGGLSIDSPGTLVGSGVIAATLGGAGLVAPGNSPGILTAQAVDPTGGLDWAFEITGTAPTYGDASASVNDVLRLTGTAPFTTGLNSGNVVSLYFSSSPALGDVFQGGFFTDAGSGAVNLQSLMTSGSFVGYYPQAGGAYSHNGQSYALLSTLGLGVEPGATTVATAGFDNGNTPVTGGQITTFTVVVPEPAGLALAALGLGLAGWAARRRRRRLAPLR